MIFHITSRADWETAQQRGEYRAPSLDTEGFIHCSTSSQVLPVAENFYKGQRDLLLLAIEARRIPPALRGSNDVSPLKTLVRCGRTRGMLGELCS